MGVSVIVAPGLGFEDFVAYAPAFGIVGDPAKSDPKTRLPADHSLAFICRTSAKAWEAGKVPSTVGSARLVLLLSPCGYDKDALFEPNTRALMA